MPLPPAAPGKMLLPLPATALPSRCTNSSCRKWTSRSRSSWSAAHRSSKDSSTQWANSSRQRSLYHPTPSISGPSGLHCWLPGLSRNDDMLAVEYFEVECPEAKGAEYYKQIANDVLLDHNLLKVIDKLHIFIDPKVPIFVATGTLKKITSVIRVRDFANVNPQEGKMTLVISD